MMPDPRFDPNYDGDMTMCIMLANNSRTENLTIISGEFPSLNKRKLRPGQRIDVAIEIPQGYREFIHDQKILGKEYLYVGLRDKDAAEPFVHIAENL